MLYKVQILNQFFVSHKKLIRKVQFVHLSIIYFPQPLGRLTKESLAGVLPSCVLSHLQLSQTFYLNIYFSEQCQEGQKPIVEGHLFN